MTADDWIKVTDNFIQGVLGTGVVLIVLASMLGTFNRRGKE